MQGSPKDQSKETGNLGKRKRGDKDKDNIPQQFQLDQFPKTMENTPHDFSNQTPLTKEQIQEDLLNVTQCFLQELQKVGINKFNIYKANDITFEFLETMMVVMRGVTKPMLKGFIRDEAR